MAGIHLYRKAVLFDAAGNVVDTDDVLAASRLLVDVASSVRGDGSRKADSREHDLLIESASPDLIYWARRWERDGTAIRAILEGQHTAEGRHTQWLEAVPPLVVQSEKGIIGEAAIGAQLYSALKSASVYEDYSNLLRYLGWTGQSNAPAGYAVTAASSTPSAPDPDDDGIFDAAGSTFTDDGTWTIQTDTGGSSPYTFTPYVDIVLPLVGRSVTLGVNVTQVHTSLTTHQIRVQALDVSGSVLDTTTTTVSSTGFKTAALTLPASTYFVRCYIALLSGTNPVGQCQIDNPVLVLGWTPTEAVKY